MKQSNITDGKALTEQRRIVKSVDIDDNEVDNEVIVQVVEAKRLFAGIDMTGFAVKEVQVDEDGDARTTLHEFFDSREEADERARAVFNDEHLDRNWNIGGALKGDDDDEGDE